jgi:SAM-dependent methyltransferase
MHESTYQEMQKFVASLPKTPLKIADVGSYNVNGVYRPLFENPGWTYTGLDICAGPNVDVVLSSETEWKNIPDETYDVVISGSTLEHTRHPWLFVKEIARIMKKGGLVCIIAPYEWEYHPHPIDCWRVFPDGMRAVMEWNGLTVLETRMNVNSPDARWRGDTVGIAKRP